jgi:hypothetical protein
MKITTTISSSQQYGDLLDLLGLCCWIETVRMPTFRRGDISMQVIACEEKKFIFLLFCFVIYDEVINFRSEKDD